MAVAWNGVGNTPFPCNGWLGAGAQSACDCNRLHPQASPSKLARLDGYAGLRVVEPAAFLAELDAQG